MEYDIPRKLSHEERQFAPTAKFCCGKNVKIFNRQFKIRPCGKRRNKNYRHFVC